MREVDNLGRIVIPKELRKMYDIKKNDGLEIFVDENKIILRKYEPGCIFCGNLSDVIECNGKKICKECIEEM